MCSHQIFLLQVMNENILCFFNRIDRTNLGTKAAMIGAKIDRAKIGRKMPTEFERHYASYCLFEHKTPVV
jgi:hypothetical protein